MPMGDNSRRRWPNIEISEIRSPRIPGYVNIYHLSLALGAKYDDVRKAAQLGVLKPDVKNNKSVFFREERIEELKHKWNSWLEKPKKRTGKSRSQDWGPARGVITQFGMMRSRERPIAEVLERLMRSRPRSASRDGSYRTRKHYNLEDLTS